MKSTFKILFYLKRDKIKKNGKMPIFCRITVDGSASRFNLKAEIDPKYWNADFARATGKSKEATDINQILESTSASLHVIYRRILEKDNYITAEKVKNSFLGLSTDSTTLLQLYQQHNDDMEKSVGITVAKATLQKYQVTYKRLEEFMKSRYNISDINLKEIDHRFITEFEFFLRTDSKCNVNTTYKYMRFFKKIVIMARNNGWILTDPFGNYKIRYEKVDRGYLTDTELLTMRNKEFGSERLEQVRDVFMFSCYSGLAYVDVIKRMQSSDSIDLNEFLDVFKNVSAVWKIFLLHIIKPTKYPIYDQHIHRAYSYIQGLEYENISASSLSDRDKEGFYFNIYLPFIEKHSSVNLKKLDEALFTFGKFLRTEKYSDIINCKTNN